MAPDQPVDDADQIGSAESMEPSHSPGEESARRWWRRPASVTAVAAVALVSVASVVLRALTPMWVILYAADDDQLYVRLGKSLIDGEWLGVYDRRTLEKPAGFSMFLAMAHLIPLPFLMVVHLFHLAAAAFFAYALARVTSRKVLGVAAYLVLALDPSYFSNGASRVVRDSWYSSLSLIIVGCAILAIPAVGRSAVDRGPARRIGIAVIIGLVAGVCMTGFWLGRVERPWLLPPVVALLACGVVMRSKNFMTADPAAKRLTSLARASAVVALPCVVAVGVLISSLSFVTWKNERAYGVAIIDDFYTGQFARMYGDWQSVQAGPERRYISISKAQREAVYAVSPLARELESNIESPDNLWLGLACTYTGICDDIVAGWLLFGLRDATFAAGHYDDARDAQQYWSQVADQIEAACDDGRLTCRQPIPFSLPDPARVHLGAWWSSTVAAFDYLREMRGADPRRPLSGEPSTPTDDELWSLFRSTVRGLPATLESQREQERASMSWLEHLTALRDTYRQMLVIALPLSILGYALALLRRRPLWSRIFAIGLSAGLAVAARLVLLGFVDSTSFPATDQPTYILPATAFLFAFAVCGLYLLAVSLAPSRHGRNDESPEPGEVLGGAAVDLTPATGLSDELTLEEKSVQK